MKTETSDKICGSARPARSLPAQCGACPGLSVYAVTAVSLCLPNRAGQDRQGRKDKAGQGAQGIEKLSRDCLYQINVDRRFSE